MQNRVVGTTMPVLEFPLDPNETIISEAGELSWMGASIQMTTHTQLPEAAASSEPSSVSPAAAASS